MPGYPEKGRFSLGFCSREGAIFQKPPENLAFFPAVAYNKCK